MEKRVVLVVAMVAVLVTLPSLWSQTITTTGSVLKSSELLGMEVKNHEGDDLGHVSDLMVDVAKGEIEYAALSVGAVAGIGGKLFAVPYRELTQRLHEGEAYFVLRIDSAALNNAPGFAENDWPDFADRDWRDQIDKYYRDHGSVSTQTLAESTPGADRSQLRETSFRDQPYQMVRASELVGMEIKNSAGEDLGHVEDLVVDSGNGRVRYAALAYGGILGIGDKLFAVPFNAFTLKKEADGGDQYLLVNIDVETLKHAPGFDQANWPDFGNPRWSEDIDQYYQSRPHDVEGAPK